MKAIEIAQKMYKNLGENHTLLLEENNLHSIFGSIYNGLPKVAWEDKNRIVCYIIFAYDPASGWLNLQQDRRINQLNILNNLAADFKSELFEGILKNNNDIVGMCIFNFLENLKDWRWRKIYDLLEFANRIQDIVNKDENTEDIDLLVKINKGKGALLEESIEKINMAHELIRQIQKDFVSTDNATHQDFGFQLTAESKSNKLLSWRQWIRQVNAAKAQQA